MTSLSKPEFGTPASKLRARYLADNCYELLAKLVEVRHRRGLSQAEVGEMLGITQQAVSKLEAMDANPRLSTIRQYAHAVGALFVVDVAADEGQLEQHGAGWAKVSFESVQKAPSAPQAATAESAAKALTDLLRDSTVGSWTPARRSDFTTAA